MLLVLLLVIMMCLVYLSRDEDMFGDCDTIVVVIGLLVEMALVIVIMLGLFIGACYFWSVGVCDIGHCGCDYNIRDVDYEYDMW